MGVSAINKSRASKSPKARKIQHLYSVTISQGARGIQAMKDLQIAMKGKFEKADIYSDNDILELCREVRAEVESE
jgi:hypothetical protein